VLSHRLEIPLGQEARHPGEPAPDGGPGGEEGEPEDAGGQGEEKGGRAHRAMLPPGERPGRRER
jgi:hypothetical protein